MVKIPRTHLPDSLAKIPFLDRKVTADDDVTIVGTSHVGYEKKFSNLELIKTPGHFKFKSYIGPSNREEALFEADINDKKQIAVHGDSGAPVFVTRADKSLAIAGIVSAGSKSVMHLVSVKYHEKWIHTIASAFCESL